MITMLIHNVNMHVSGSPLVVGAMPPVDLCTKLPSHRQSAFLTSWFKSVNQFQGYFLCLMRIMRNSLEGFDPEHPTCNGPEGSIFSLIIAKACALPCQKMINMIKNHSYNRNSHNTCLLRFLLNHSNKYLCFIYTFWLCDYVWLVQLSQQKVVFLLQLNHQWKHSQVDHRLTAKLLV